MTHALKTLTEELSYLRSMHTMATDQGKSIIANSVAIDIADCEAALEVLTPNRDCGTNTTPTQEAALARDPIVRPASSSSGKPSNASAGRIKSISGGGPNFSGSNATRKTAPPPNNPYKG